MKIVVGDAGFGLDDVRKGLGGLGVDVVRSEAPWTGADVVGLLLGTDVGVSEDDLDELPGLRVVATCSVGFDHVPVEAATARGIWVCNVPDYCVEEVADHSLALVLSLLRGVVELDRSVRAGRWDHTASGELRRLRGTRLGIVGFGRIGQALAERARALGFEIWATDPFVDDAVIAGAGARPAELDELLEASDAVSLHLPLTRETNGLIGADRLARMRPDAVLVDTARAQLVDLDALVDALEHGRLGGAALDVLSVEPPTAKQPAPQAPRLVVNPHAAWYSAEAEEAVYRRPVASVRAVLEGREPPDAVNRP